MTLRLLSILFLGTLSLIAQTNHVINWLMGVTPAESTITIEPGDSVTWLWMDELAHSVTSTEGPETFESGIISGGDVFIHTFTD
jgi:plastocyanin